MADYKSEIVGDHASIRDLKRLVARAAKSPVRTVLIYGETGTGKGLVARMIHRLSSRADKEFVDINCAAIPASLLESELFGHERGAFTGAGERKVGLIEAANHGTIFLDEIREMDLTLQAKLLSLLDTHQFRRVGAVRTTSVDVRFIAATNKILLSEVTAGKFREDLYYRLQVVAINLPALRERGEDILALANYFIGKYNAFYDRSIRPLSAEMEDIFMKYPWPGNVRELENLLERIFILEDDDTIQPRHLPDRIMRTVRAGSRTVTPPAAGVPPILVQGGDAIMPDPASGFHNATAAFQTRLIEKALAATGNNVQNAASLLRMSRHALRHQMQKLGLSSA